MRPIDRRVSERIGILRTLLIFGIVVLHVPPVLNAADIGHDPFNYLKYALSRGLFRSTVPVLTCISAYLLFAGVNRLDYRKAITGKTQRILFPFLLWNLPLVALLFVVESQGFTGHHFRVALLPYDPMTFANAAFAVREEPINYPLDFLRDLFMLFLLSPVFLWLIRNARWVGLAAVAVFFLKDWDGLLILRSAMPISFYLGGMAAVYRWDLERFDRLWPLALLALVAASAIIAGFAIENVEWFRIVSPPLVWIAATPIVGTAIGNRLKILGGDSFFLFLAHGPLLLVTYMLYEGTGAPFAYPLYWLAAPVAVIAFALGTNHLLKRHLPSLAAFLVGDFKSLRKKAPLVAPLRGNLLADPGPAASRSEGKA